LLLAFSLPTFDYVCSLHYGARGANRTLGEKTSLRKDFQSLESKSTCFNYQLSYQSARTKHLLFE